VSDAPVTVTVGAGAAEPPTIDLSGISRYVESALTTVPEGHHVAVVGYLDHAGTARGVVAVRAGEHWRFAAHVEKPRSAGLTAGAAVLFSF
jgi:hypothetical protein